MSFEQNDHMHTIHLGNYEEFFILYMDGELSPEQVKMVDEFLEAHPDLKSDFDMLMSTKLTVEEFPFDKTSLFSENMKLTSLDEELLLYIDNELPSDKKNIVELELAANKEYGIQHSQLLRAKLDPAEHITYPYKKELYRRTQRSIGFQPWMRVAAAVVVVALAGVLYLTNSPSSDSTDGTALAGVPKPSSTRPTNSVPATVVTGENQTTTDPDAQGKTETRKDPRKGNAETVEPQQQQPVGQELYANISEPEGKVNLDRSRVTSVETNVIAGGITEESFNTGSVTSSLAVRTNIEQPVEQAIEPTDNDRKGSVRGFLRKATRMIEKRTGFDPTNDDGALLIGAVSINLK